uniref:hypothetical protein n=1 Tax=Nonomuraea pusilla TaxID=46177 RepID=UPI0006E2610A|nr:hypothetical protein [Nonomuraea pusilla]
MRRRGRHTAHVPFAFAWNGSETVRKLRALRENRMVALTIGAEPRPPWILLVRGRAGLDVVDGVPDEHLQATGAYG